MRRNGASVSPKKQSLASSYVLPAASSHRMNGSADAAGPLASVTSSGVPIARQCQADVSECSLEAAAAALAAQVDSWQVGIISWRGEAAPLRLSTGRRAVCWRRDRSPQQRCSWRQLAAAGGSWRLPDSLERGRKLVLSGPLVDASPSTHHGGNAPPRAAGGCGQLGTDGRHAARCARARTYTRVT